MTTNTLVPLAPRFFNHQLTSTYLLIPNCGKYAEEIVLTRKNLSDPGQIDRSSGHPVPFWERECSRKGTFPAHDFLFDHAHYIPDYNEKKTSSKYAHVQDLSDTYDRDGTINSSPRLKGMHVDLYL